MESRLALLCITIVTIAAAQSEAEATNVMPRTRDMRDRMLS
jgi:hypothetical protein